MRFLSRLVSRLLLRLLMPLVLGGLVLAWQGRLPLTAGGPDGGAAAAPGTVDPQAEADRVARTLGELAARLRDGRVYDAAPSPGVPGPAVLPTAPSPRFAAPPNAASGDTDQNAGNPRILNGGGAGSFHRAPQALP